MTWYLFGRPKRVVIGQKLMKGEGSRETMTGTGCFVAIGMNGLSKKMNKVLRQRQPNMEIHRKFIWTEKK